jgi:hypothetical protein
MATRDISSSVADYREAVRRLWNNHYLPMIADKNPWDVCDAFDDIGCLLFKDLVLDPIGLAGAGPCPGRVSKPTPVAGLFVRPAGTVEMPIHIARDLPGTSRIHCWDHPKTHLQPGEATLRFIRFFDFDLLAIREWEYVLVQIESCPTGTDLAGRFGLVRFPDASFIADVHDVHSPCSAIH